MSAIDRLKTLFETIHLAAQAHQVKVDTDLAKADAVKDLRIADLERRLAELERKR